MLPAPPASCAGWWFSQLWRALLASRPERAGNWSFAYPEPGRILAHLSAAQAHGEIVAGLCREGAERRCAVSWDFPGEDGMQHTVRASWQPGEAIVRPLDWSHLRRPFPMLDSRPDAVPWPLSVRIAVHGWHGQLLERADLEADDGTRAYPVSWAPPFGEPRLPATELPCSLTILDGRQGGLAGIILAGLTIPWQIDLDRETWVIWRRIDGSAILDNLGGARGACPRHGIVCPWPLSGRTR